MSLTNDKKEVLNQELIYSVEGIDGIIELYEDRIIIKREKKSLLRWALHGVKGKKDIILNHIAAVQIRDSVLGYGYIQFTLTGNNKSKGRFGRTISAAMDEDTVFFSTKRLNDFIELKDLINTYIRSANKKENSQIEILEKLAELRNSGILTEEEFNFKKKELLDRI